MEKVLSAIGVAVFCGLLTVFCANSVVTIGGKTFLVRDYEKAAREYIESSVTIFDLEGMNEFVSYEPEPLERSIWSALRGSEYVPTYTVSYDQEGLMAFLEDYNMHATPSSNAYLTRESGVWELVPEVYGNKIDILWMMNNINGSDKVICSRYFIKPSVIESDLQETYEQLVMYSNWQATYSDGTVVQSCADYVNIDKYGDIELDTDFLCSAVKSVASSYSTVGEPRSFTTSAGENIEVAGGTWGSQVDFDAELQFLENSFKSCEAVVNRTPNWSVVQGNIGASYIEVSIDGQHVWHYVSGVLCCDSPCVTGICDNTHNTPRGIYYLLERQNGRVLRPEGSESGTYVNYWMRVTWDGVGLHDAYWRSAFGGQIYKSNGSHGCINLPKDYAEKLYNEVKTGLPVVIY